MHESPANLGLPVSQDDARPVAESLGFIDLSRMEDPRDDRMLHAIAPILPISLPGKKKPDNWLAPTSEEKAEVKPSGWGWLADEVLKQQQNKQGEEEVAANPDDNEEEKGRTKEDPQQMESSQPGLLNASFERVPTESLLAGEKRNSESAPGGDGREPNKPEASSEGGAFAADFTPNDEQKAPTGPRGDRLSGADSMWEPNQMRERRSIASASLPQTRDLITQITSPRSLTDAQGKSPTAGSESLPISRMSPQHIPTVDFSSSAGFSPAPVNTLQAGSIFSSGGNSLSVPGGFSKPSSPLSGSSFSQSSLKPISPLRPTEPQKPLQDLWPLNPR